jgi:hypothetical protein
VFGRAFEVDVDVVAEDAGASQFVVLGHSSPYAMPRCVLEELEGNALVDLVPLLRVVECTIG